MIILVSLFLILMTDDHLTDDGQGGSKWMAMMKTKWKDGRADLPFTSNSISNDANDLLYY